MLKVYNANVYYGKIHAIKGVSFEVNEGEIVSLIGANGAGKSTILRTVSGLLRSKTGTISFEGKSIGNVPAHKIVKMGLAQVPEGAAHLPANDGARKPGDGCVHPEAAFLRRSGARV